MNHQERVEDVRISELESKYIQLSEEYRKTLEENRGLRAKEVDLKKEVQTLKKGRDSFKEQFLELREINKDLKRRFIEIEGQMGEYEHMENFKVIQEKENCKVENQQKE